MRLVCHFFRVTLIDLSSVLVQLREAPKGNHFRVHFHIA